MVQYDSQDARPFLAACVCLGLLAVGSIIYAQQVIELRQDSSLLLVRRGAMQIDGLRSVKIKSNSEIEISRDRQSLLGALGPETQMVKLGDVFNLHDAHHIFLSYRLITIRNGDIHLEEHNRSRLEDKEPLDTKRILVIKPY